MVNAVTSDRLVSTAVLVNDMDEEAVLREIQDKAGITLQRIPTIPRARLESWESTSIVDHRCVRLNYRDLEGEKNAAPSFSIFAVPISNVDVPSEMIDDIEGHHLCKCVRVDGMTVFCFRDAGRGFPSGPLN